MLHKFLIVLSISCASFGSVAQDTVSVMYYNLLKFPLVNSGRIAELETICQYYLPDVLIVNELTSSSGANLILSNALNTQGITHYDKANYVSGPDTENMLYYNSNKLGLVSQDEIATSVRDINEYVLYYKDPALDANSDTVYLYMYACHLKAGSDISNEQERETQTNILWNFLEARTGDENTFVGGDFNIYGSYEGAYTNLTAPSKSDLHDPIGAGTYHNNSSYAIHHTQSTRTTSFDNGATGGMDDRFDMILFSDDILFGNAGVSFINGSYESVGQDGLRFNGSLISPTNNSAPNNVISALYYMSDHLPVMADFLVDMELKVPVQEPLQSTYYIVDNALNIVLDQDIKGVVDLYDLTGKLLSSTNCIGTLARVDINDIPKGIYVARVSSDKGNTYVKFVK